MTFCVGSVLCCLGLFLVLVLCCWKTPSFQSHLFSNKWDSLSRTKRFYDRLSLERARHGPKKKINCFLAGRSDACGVWVCVCVWNYRRFTSLDLTAFGGMTFDRTFLLLRGVS